MIDDADEIAAWLELLRTPQLGAARIRTLVRSFGSARNALRTRGVAWRELGIAPDAPSSTPRREVKGAIAADIAWLDADFHALLRFDDDAWPALLDRIPDPPAALFVRGDPGCLWQPQVAVVGSRHATRGGLEHAREFAAGLAARGITITSGFARGIDSAAHAAALAAGGITVAVCGTGLDVDYPRGSAGLADAISQTGALVSEHPLGAPPLAAHFPQRNRLISGLALGTLVIEAGLKSGSLITARLAAEQGREVFAVPGSIRNPLARGCHALIRDGARLVESVEEVCDAVAPMAAELASAIRSRLHASGESSISASANMLLSVERRSIAPCELVRVSRGSVDSVELASCGPEHSSSSDVMAQMDPLLEAIGFDPVALENLFGAVDLDTAAVSARLMTLELAGFVEALPGARYVRLR